MNQRPLPGSRPRYRGAFNLWLTLAALPAAAQIAPLTPQTLFFNQGSRSYTDSLAANAGLLYTNNATYTSGGAGATLALVGLSGDTARQGSRLDYHLDADIAVAKYLNGAFPTQLTGYLDGMAALKIVPGFFSWIVRDTYTQVQINPYAAVTPDNVVNLNYITTGPRFTMRPTLRTSVTLEGLYSYLSSNSPSAQFIDLDSHRYGGNLRIDRAFTHASSLYLKGSYEKVDFKDQVHNNNFSIGEAVAGFRLSSPRTSLDLSGGYSKVRVENLAVPVQSIIGIEQQRETRTFGGATWRVNLSRVITPSERISLFAGQQFTDVAAAAGLSFDQAVPIYAPVQIAAGAPFQARSFGADWRLEGLRSTLDVSVGAFQTRYVVNSSYLVDATLFQTPNTNSRVVSAMFARQLSPVLTWNIGASFQHWTNIAVPGQPVPAGPSSLNTSTALTSLSWRVGERLGLRFILLHTSQIGVGATQVGVIAFYALTSSAKQALTQTPGLGPTSPVSMQTMPRY